MNLTITIKTRLYIDQSDIPKLKEVCEQYRLACNFVSQWVFDNQFELNSNKVQKSVYEDCRQLFNLKSQMAASVPKTVTARYKTTKTQLSQKPYKYQDENGKCQRIGKTLEWLWKPIQFKRSQVDLVRNRDYSFVDNGQTLSVNTLQGRVKCKFSCKGFEHYLPDYTLGTAKLLESKGKWFEHLAATKEVADYNKQSITNVVGIDRGLRHIMTTYDSKGTSAFFSGKKISQTRKHYRKLRTSLQKRNSKSSKRRIRLIEKRENRWMTDMNHQLSKTLINQYGNGTVFVLEDLTGVRFVTEQVSKKHRYEQVSWSFFQLEQFLTYKASINGSQVVKVAAEYTSQRCPKCGKIDKEQRKKEIHEYHCSCGYKSNDDRIGAMNIQLLGTQWVTGTDERPRFEKITVTG